MAVLQLDPGSSAQLLTTELNSLANGSAAIDSSSYDNATNLYPSAAFELDVTFGSAATAGAPVDLYLIYAPDGTNFGDNTTGASPKTPLSQKVGTFYCLSQTANQLVAVTPAGQQYVELLPFLFKAYVVNGSGQAFPASGSTVTIYPFKYESV